MKKNHLTKMISLSVALNCLAIVAFVNKADAFTFFTANLSGNKETNPNNSTATGFGSVWLNDTENSITVNLSWSGLTANASVAHIHGPALQGSNAPVLFGFSGVPNTTSGAIPEQIFSINPTQVGYLKNGLLYFNVHSSNFPSGEIRGQIEAVPEPLTILGALTATGFGISFKRRLMRANTQSL